VYHHFSADDTQLWTAVNLDDTHEIATALRKLERCTDAIFTWMHHNKLKLNVEKTELLVIHPKYRKTKVPDIQLKTGESVVTPNHSIRNLGVMFDETMSFEGHISAVRKAGFWHAWNINTIKKYLPHQLLESLVHAFITSRIDFCNSLMKGLPLNQIQRLQKLQNHAARIISSTNMRTPITPVLCSFTG
jgi:hypothetical protein